MTRDALHVDDSGEGKTIVFLHGYLSSSHYFKHIRHRLEKNFRVIALDLLGFGRSPKPKIEYTYDEHIGAIRDTLRHMEVTGPVILLGHSMGALIALRYALRFPDDISRLILFNPPLFTDTHQMIAAHKATGLRYRMMLYSQKRNLYWRIVRLSPRTTSHRRPAINFSDIVVMSPHAREGSYKNILGGSTVFTDLEKVRVPTLLVNGKYDRAVYNENIENWRPKSNIAIITLASGHHPLVRNISDSEDAIRSYLLQ